MQAVARQPREGVDEVLRKVLAVLYFFQKPHTPYADGAHVREYRQHVRAWHDVCAREHEQFKELLDIVQTIVRTFPEPAHLNADAFRSNLATVCVDLERLMAWGQGETARDAAPCLPARVRQIQHLLERFEAFVADVESTSAAGSGR